MPNMLHGGTNSGANDHRFGKIHLDFGMARESENEFVQFHTTRI